MLGVINIQLVYRAGEWQACAPMGDTPFEDMKNGEASAGCIVVMSILGDEMDAALEKLAAKLMNEVNNK